MAIAASWASVAVTLILGIAGFVVARNINKDFRLRLAKRRLAAYERLWALMRPASPYSEPLNEEGRRRLFDSFTDWYFCHGDGILLDHSSRSMYFGAKDNLVCQVEDLTPESSRQRLKQLNDPDLERQRRLLAQRQLSLLRAKLRADLTVYGQPYGHKLDREDREFLEYYGVDIHRKPWSEVTDETERPGYSPQDSAGSQVT
jgi:hypothetical protein